MRKKMLLISVLLSTFGLANIREYRPNFERLDLYKGAKVTSGILQEFNNVTPSYAYSKVYDKKNTKYVDSNNIGVGVGFLSYNYDIEQKSHTLLLQKDISQILDTGIIKNYYQKVNEFYKLKEKRKEDYKNILNAYFSYLENLVVLKEYRELEKNSDKILEISKLNFDLGKISKIELDNIKLKTEYSKLNLESKELELKVKEQLLNMYNINKDNINDSDIDIYEISNEKIEKYINYENEKINNQNNLIYYTNLKNKIDVFMPNINLSYSNSFTNLPNDNGNFTVKISKSFTLADSQYIDNKLSENNIKFQNKILEDEIRQYNLMKNLVNMQKQKYNLSEKELEIAKLKLDLGKISILDYMEKLEKNSNQKIELIKAKINLSKYILERE